MKQIEEIFALEGPLQKKLSYYTVRAAQAKMAHQVANALRERQISLIEAGTGTGKSMAYLVPAVLEAQSGKRCVISTHTITLQQQLLGKDLPGVVHALGAKVHAVLVKGMQNYLCLRKLEEATQERNECTIEEAQQIETIAQWAEETQDGSLATLPLTPNRSVWERVGAESDACTHVGCPHYQQCFFMKARKEAEKADLLIVNHALLMADVRARFEERQGVLPEYHKVILDEAHHLEDVATEALGWRITKTQFSRLFSLLGIEGSRGKVVRLQRHLVRIESLSDLTFALTNELPAFRRDILITTAELFDALAAFTDQQRAGPKLRVIAPHLETEFWVESIVPLGKQLTQQLNRVVVMLNGMDEQIKDTNDEKLVQQTENLRFDIQVIARRLESLKDRLHEFLFQVPPASSVRWISLQESRGFVNVQLCNTSLNVAPILIEHLFMPDRSCVLTSATLTSANSFSFIRNRLGIDDVSQEVTEASHPSPFAYEQQALLLVVNDLPDPSEPRFTEAVIAALPNLIEASNGGCFILFTSYQLLRRSFDALSSYLQEQNLCPLAQGDGERELLLRRFKEHGNAVLFGTDSFWEGVDVVGDSLRSVIIPKLPFKVPTEPIVQARLQAIREANGNPFGDYALPQAIVKFKQGFGRLIRSTTDRGSVCCLDKRLASRSYGRLFLRSVPPCKQRIDSLKTVVQSLELWFLDKD